MQDILSTIEPKSDQLNADDLIGDRTITIKITEVSIMASDQPVSLHYEGDNGKPYKPGKSMRRIIVAAWGVNVSQYVGRRMTLYRDDTVTFGGVAVGGLRISHMSHLKQNMTLALTAARSKRKPYTVEPLAEEIRTPPGIRGTHQGEVDSVREAELNERRPVPDPAIEHVGDLFDLIEKGNEAAAGGMVREFWASLSPAQRKAIGAAQLETWKAVAKNIISPIDNNV